MKKRRDQLNRGAGNRAQTSGQTLVSYDVGALPILNRLIERMRLADFFRDVLAPMIQYVWNVLEQDRERPADIHVAQVIIE